MRHRWRSDMFTTLRRFFVPLLLQAEAIRWFNFTFTNQALFVKFEQKKQCLLKNILNQYLVSPNANDAMNPPMLPRQAAFSLRWTVTLRHQVDRWNAAPWPRNDKAPRHPSRIQNLCLA